LYTSHTTTAISKFYPLYSTDHRSGRVFMVMIIQIPWIPPENPFCVIPIYYLQLHFNISHIVSHEQAIIESIFLVQQRKLFDHVINSWESVALTWHQWYCCVLMCFKRSKAVYYIRYMLIERMSWWWGKDEWWLSKSLTMPS